MAVLELINLKKEYANGARAVDGLNLVVNPGEFLVLVGPSGCGKSTILRLIAGLEVPSSGDILMGKQRVNEFEPKERDVAMVFQNYALYPHMSVEKNIGFPLKMSGMKRADAFPLIREAARSLGIENLLKRKPGQLSGGQQQRVALARALVRRPQFFLFDEPLSNLDAQLRVTMRLEISNLHRTTESTMVYVTHDQVEAMTLGTRIAVLKDGVLQQVGAPLEVYRQPANVFVAEFIGSPPMNICRESAADLLRPAHAPMDCVVGFRPHDVHPGSALEAIAERVEELGNETLIHALFDGEWVTMAWPATHAPREGKAFGFDLPDAALHLFDSHTGNRLQ